MSEAVCYLKKEIWCKSKQLANRAESKKKQFKILIVDDDINIASTFGEILEYRGHDVTIVNEGIKCISKCQYNHYDIIFMDFHLTDDEEKYDETNGAEVTDLLKTVCSVDSIVIAITGDNSCNAINKFKEVGMCGALIKPFCIDTINKLMELLESIKEIFIEKNSNILKKINNKLTTNLIVF